MDLTVAKSKAAFQDDLKSEYIFQIIDENNRSTVIVCASVLDTQLENLLKKVFYIDKNIENASLC